MSAAESPRHGRSGGGPLTVASQPPSDRTLIDTVSGFISDVTLATAPAADPRDTIQWAHFETADINEPVPEGDHETELSPLLLVLGYGSGVQIWLIPPNGEAQEVMSWRQGSVRVLRILPTPAGGDSFAVKRPLLALCDSAGPGPLYCSLSFISIRGGDQVKSIKFKNPILDVLANKRSVVVSFSERFAVFDACTLEDRMAVTTCYPCPCPLGGSSAVNPLALGDRWLAYADKKLNSAKRSSGGCEGEGVSSYTATVLHAAKSLSKGLRGLGESVASSLAGGRTLSQSPSPPNADHQQPGVVTILDIEAPSEEDGQDDEEACDSVVAHFVAHSDAIISLKFDASGMLLVTADKRGHDFHVFRVHPHPCGPSLASVHHLYILHRGDTTAKVQDISISLDSRWAAVSTLRGTTHVFPISPYGGPCGVRTHTQPRVVNRLSRFHRSAGLPIHASNARSSSPVGDGIAQGAWFPNPRLPPYPLPTTGTPLAQLRPMPAATGIPTHTITRNSSGRQRLSSLSEDTGGVPLLACARWGAAPPAPPAPPASLSAPRTPAAHALYVMASTGHLLHYLIHPRHAAGVSKEKVCDDTPVELGVELVAQWPLNRPPAASDMASPLAPNNPLLHRPHFKSCSDAGVSEEERWLAHVEIVTHAGPHRRLWMGPQFVFKTYNATLSGSSSSLLEAEAVEVEAGAGGGAARSPPVNMPGARPLVPVLIDSGSASSLEHSPSDSFRRKSYIMEAGGKPVGDKVLGDVQLREDLAEAMRETEQGSRCGDAGPGLRVAAVARAVDPLGTVVAPGEDDDSVEDDDPDQYTQANADEALFRPVVRAPAALPPHPELSASPLPAGTRIPVQNLMRADPLTPDDDSVPLKSEVVIPAALTGAQRTSAYTPQDTSAPVQCSLEQNVTSVQTFSENRDIHKSAMRRSGKNDEGSPQRSSAKKDKHVSSQRYSAKKDEPSSPQCSSAKKDEHVLSQRGSVKKDESGPCERSSAKKDEQLSREHSSTRKDEHVFPLRGSVKKHEGVPPERKSPLKDELVPPQRCSPLKDEPISRGHGLAKKDENISSQSSSVKKDEHVSPQRGSAMIDEHITSRPSPVVEDGNLAIQRRSVERDTFSIQRSSGEKDEHFLSHSSAKKVHHISPHRRSVERDEDICPQRRSVKKEEYISQRCSTKNEEIVTVQPRSLKKVEHVFVPRHSVERIVPREPVVEIQIKVETIPAGAEHVDETISADKPVKVNKSSNKGKSRDKRSATTREEPLLSDKRKEEDDANVVSLPKSKETAPSDIQMCGPKPSVRLSTKNISKNISEGKQAVEIKDDAEAQDAVEFTIRLPASKDEPREIEGSAKDEVCVEDVCRQVDKPIKVEVVESEPFNKTEDQIWAMLSNSSRELVDKNISESRKFSEEIKPKPRKNKKQRKSELESEEMITDLPTVDPFLSVMKEDASYQQEEPIVTSSSKKEITMKPTARDKKIEPLMKEFIKAKSLSPESSINIKIKDQTTYSTHSDILNYETNITAIDKDYKSTSSSKIKTNEPTRSKKADEAVKGPLKGFDLPIDFDAYLVSKSKDKKSAADSKSSSTKKEDPLQELFSDSLFSLQPSKPKKPYRKDRVKIDDYVSIEKFQSKERVAISECKKYSPTIIDLDNESIGSKQKAEDSEIVIVDAAMEDFPTIASAHNIRSHQKRWTQPASVDNYVPPPVKSYSSIAAVSKPQKDMRHEGALGVDLAENILEPPKPCRVTLQEKLAELCKRSDIAVAECDSPDDLTFVGEHPCEFELPPLEPLDFSLDEFKLEVMRDSLLEEKLVSPVCNIDIDDILFNIKDAAGKKCSERDSTAGESVSKPELKPATKTEGEQMEKSSDDDNTPVSSQTDSDDKEDKRNAVTDPTLPAHKSGNSKKKARQKKRK